MTIAGPEGTTGREVSAPSESRAVAVAIGGLVISEGATLSLPLRVMVSRIQ